MKRIFLCILLALSMLLADVNAIAEENPGTEYNKEAVGMLSMLNIISVFDDNDDFSTQAYVTREEFCVYLSRALKIEAIAEAEQVFSDVPKESESAECINAMYDRGIVSGYAGEFRPKDVIKYNEAIKMLVSALNYNHNGSLEYPTGHLRMASSLAITKNVHATEQLTKGAAAQLIYNAMKAPFMELEYIEGTNPVFKSNSDESVLTQVYDIYKGKGVVLANGISSLVSGAVPKKNDEVLIENTIYKVGKSNVSDLLGHYIEFYYQKMDNEEYEIVMITKDDIEELVINSNQNISFGSNTYNYDDADGKRKRAHLASDFRLTYNFDYPASGFTAAMMVPAMGRIKLVKSASGGDYSAVIIESYVNHVVAGVDIENEIIYYKDSTNTDLKIGDITIFNAEGKEIGLSAINEWNIVSVLMSSDGTKGFLYVSDKEIEGKVTAIGSTDEPKITISSISYYADPSVLPSIEMGKNFKVYFDYNGNIASIRKSVSDGLRYAYLVKVKKDRNYNGTGEERVWVNLFDDNGEQKKYYLTEKVRINDTKYTIVDNTITTLLGLTENIVKYQTNSSGEIDKMYVYDPINDTAKKYIHVLQDDTTAHYWNLKQRSFDGKVTVENGIPVFAIPSGSTNADDYRIVGLGSFENDKTATAKIYTMGDNVYGEVIIKDSAAVDSITRPIAIVKKLIRAMNEDGDVCVKMVLLYNGTEQEFFVDDEITYRASGTTDTTHYNSENLIGNVGKGDIIKVGFNHRDEINNIWHIYNYSSGVFIDATNRYEPQSGALFRSANRCVLGYAYRKIDGLLRFTPSLPTYSTEPTDLENSLLSAFRIYVVDADGVHMGNENDIVDYKSAGSSCSKIIVHTMWADPEDIIIIK